MPLAAGLLAGVYLVGVTVAAFELVILAPPVGLYLVVRRHLPAGIPALLLPKSTWTTIEKKAVKLELGANFHIPLPALPSAVGQHDK